MRDQANFWPEVQALLNWGFAADGHVTPVGELVAPLEPTLAAAAFADAGGAADGAGSDGDCGCGSCCASGAGRRRQAVKKASSHATSDGVRNLRGADLVGGRGRCALFFLGRLVAVHPPPPR